MVLLLLLLLSVLVAPYSCIKYSDCGSVKGKLLDVRVSGCENEDVCSLVRGNYTHLEIDFEALADIQNVKADVDGDLSGIVLPFLGVHKKACVNSGLSCPLAAGEQYHYTTNIDVKSYFPPLKVIVLWKLMDKKNVIVCARVPAVLV